MQRRFKGDVGALVMGILARNPLSFELRAFVLDGDFSVC